MTNTPEPPGDLATVRTLAAVRANVEAELDALADSLRGHDAPLNREDPILYAGIDHLARALVNLDTRISTAGVTDSRAAMLEGELEALEAYTDRLREAIDAVLRAVEGKSADEFPGRLEALPPLLNDLEAARASEPTR